MRVVDVRPEDRFREAHIPGAVNLPLGLLIHSGNPAAETLAPSQRLDEIVGKAGIQTWQRIVIYDENLMLEASRVFWALERYGAQRVSVLDGGYPKWRQEGREVSKKIPRPQGGLFGARSGPESAASKEYVLASLTNPDVVILDARSHVEYTGQGVHSARAGHIPGAVNIEAFEVMTAGGIRVLKPADQIAALYHSAGVTSEREIIVYSQTGQRGAHSYFVLRLLGYPRVRLYDGSWAEWGNDASLPVEK